MREADDSRTLCNNPQTPVHPHVRGADSMCHPCTKSICGSSPHAWGRLNSLDVIPDVVGGSSPHAWGRRHSAGTPRCRNMRFIPTCVGQTLDGKRLVINAFGSSPHAWGRRQIPAKEDDFYAVHPHMRGADKLYLRLFPECRRFIPTCVGQTEFLPGATKLVHGSSPHAWGRRVEILMNCVVIAGSSPHAWGRRTGMIIMWLLLRFIPTCVGQTLYAASLEEKSCGSAPHAWGRRHQFCSCHVFIRFIPTCVGQTSISLSISGLFCGSSPHAWGRHRHHHAGQDSVSVHPHMRGADPPGAAKTGVSGRFIPTCVGQTRDQCFPIFLINGSSPHAWGRRARAQLPLAYFRFIPTCVGQTLGNIHVRV